MDYLLQYGLFLAKAITFVITIVAILIAIIALTSKQKAKKGELEITDLSEQINETKKSISEQLLTSAQLKAQHKEDKKALKIKQKEEKKLASKTSQPENSPQLYVIDFKREN